MGRPTDYTLELAEEICNAIATTGEGLRELCKGNPHWPARRNIYHWLVKHEDFRLLYARSKKFQVETLVDEILDIADCASFDEVNKARLQIDTRKWIAAKLCPRLYGDKIELSDDISDEIIKKARENLAQYDKS